jgi:hypothetical protein
VTQALARLQFGVRRYEALLTLGLVVLLLATWTEFGVRVAWRAAFTEPWHRPGNWVGARLALEGRSDLMYTPPDVFSAEGRRLGAVPDLFDANLPTTVIPYLPVALLDVNTARTVWILFNVACALMAWLLLLTALHLPLRVVLLLSAALPLFHPLRDNTALGEDYGLLFLAVVPGSIAAVGLLIPKNGKRSVVGGVWFGLAALVRLFYGAAMLLPALVAGARDRLLILWAAALYLAAAFITLVWLGPTAWGQAIAASLTWRERPETAVTTFQSLDGWLMHLFRYDATWNPGPLANLPGLVGPLWWASALALSLGTLWALWRFRAVEPASPARRLLPYALVIPLALILAPINEDYHHLLALLPLLVVGVSLWELSSYAGHRSPVTGHWLLAAWVALALALALIGGPWRFNVPQIGGWQALLYYPRLYGDLVLWALVFATTIWIARQSKGEERA